MARQLISSGSTFEQEIGYSRAVVDGDRIFVSGTTGFDYTTMTIADDVVAQAGPVWRAGFPGGSRCSSFPSRHVSAAAGPGRQTGPARRH